KYGDGGGPHRGRSDPAPARRGSGALGGEVHPDEGGGTREREADAHGRSERDSIRGEVRVVRDGELDVLAEDGHDLLAIEHPELPGGDVAGGDHGDPGDRRGRLDQRTVRARLVLQQGE